jgi:hypothetical protein
VASSQSTSFQTAVARRIAALPPKTTGYVTLGCVVLGMILYPTFGPNDIWTALIAGAVFGGVAGGLLIRTFFMGIEAMATRRAELAVVVAGLASLVTIWYLMR